MNIQSRHNPDLKGFEDEIKILNPKILKESQPLQEVNPLLQDARKYKSPEEFVKAQGTHVYHGTNAEFDKFDISKATNTQYGKGIYFTENPKITKQYGKKTIEVYLDKNSVLTLNEPLSTEQKNNLRKVIGKDEWDWSKNPTGEFVWNRLELTHKNPEELLIKAGIKGVQHNQQTVNGTNKNFVIFDESAIRTKSQLTDIWKKANSKQPLDNLVGTEKKGVLSSDIFKPRTYSEKPQKGVIEYGEFRLDKGSDAESVNAIMQKIKNGERPPVLIGRSTSGKLMVSDGNHTLNAYKQLGIKDIPVIEKIDGILSGIRKKAHKK